MTGRNFSRMLREGSASHRLSVSVRRIFFVALLLNSLLITSVFSQVMKPAVHTFETGVPRIQSNIVTDIVFIDNDVWFGTGRGLSMTPDNGLTFTNFEDEQIGKGGISAVAYSDGVVWIATGYDTLISGENIPAGGGLSWSDDFGQTWNFVPQPVDPNNEDSLGYKPTTTHINNITYDITIHNSTVWIASWAGGLRKSDDFGLTWTVVTPDGASFDPVPNNNHKAFSLVSTGDALWHGTAQGINKSTDNGETWINYNALNSGISGNFVTSMGKQETSGGAIVWAATWIADDTEEFTAVSRTMNGGLTWDTFLEGEKVHNFGSDGDEIYAVSDNGLHKSSNRGDHWGTYPWISSLDGTRIYTTEYYSVGRKYGTLWVGTGDGLAKSSDDGATWDIKRAFAEPGSEGEPDVFAYPNPFSPSRDNVLGGDGHVRFQYKVTVTTSVKIDVFDFGMNLVTDIINQQKAPGNHAAVWDGRNKWGRMVANGVYFFRVQIGEDEHWGKLIIMN